MQNPLTFLICVYTLAWVPVTNAHYPHDIIRDIELSPDYTHDNTVYTFQINGRTFSAIDIVMESNDGGLSWRDLPIGLEHAHKGSSLALSPRFDMDGVMAYATDNRGLFVTTNRGASWRYAYDGFISQKLIQTEIAAWRAGALHLFVLDANGKLHRSDNMGADWSQDLLGGGYYVNHIAIPLDYSVEPNVVAALSGGLVALSADGGASWELVPLGSKIGEVRQVAISDNFSTDHTFYVGGTQGLVRSVDGGQTFERVDLGLPDEPISVIALSPHFAFDQTVFLGTDNTGVFKSIDGGLTWTLSTPPLALAAQSDRHYLDIEISRNYQEDATVFLGAFEGLFRSTDGAESWREFDTRPPDQLTEALVIDEKQQVWVSSYTGGAYLTNTDCLGLPSPCGAAPWRPANVGLARRVAVEALASSSFQDGDPPITWAGQEQVLLEFDEAANRWVRHPIPDVNPEITWNIPFALEPLTADGEILAGMNKAGIILTEDGGGTWALVDDADNTAVYSIARSPMFELDSLVFASNHHGRVFRSRDRGRTWVDASTGLDLSGPWTRWAMLAFSPAYSSDSTLLVATQNGLFRTTNQGDNWARVDDPVFDDGAIVWDVAYSPDYESDDTIVATIQGRGVVRSRDAGATWELVGRDLAAIGEQPRLLRFGRYRNGDVFLLGIEHVDIWQSTDFGLSWSSVSLSPVRYEDAYEGTTQSLVYSGQWRQVASEHASGSLYHETTSQGSAVRLLCKCTGFELYGPIGPDYGAAEVYVDGRRIGTFSAFNDAARPLAALFTRDGLALEVHEIKIVSNGPKLGIDAIDVFRTPEYGDFVAGKPSYVVGGDDEVLIWKNAFDQPYQLRVNSDISVSGVHEYRIKLLATKPIREVNPVLLEQKDQLHVGEFGFDLQAFLSGYQDGIDFELAPNSAALVAIEADGRRRPDSARIGRNRSMVQPSGLIVEIDAIGQIPPVNPGDDVGLFVGRAAESDLVEFRWVGNGLWAHTELDVLTDGRESLWTPIDLEPSDKVELGLNGVSVSGGVGDGFDGLDVYPASSTMLGIQYAHNQQLSSHNLEIGEQMSTFNAFSLPQMTPDGVPEYDLNSDTGIHLWKEDGLWKLRVTAGAEHYYEVVGRLIYDQEPLLLQEVNLEAQDYVNQDSPGVTEFKLGVYRGRFDGLDLQFPDGTEIHLDISAPANAHEDIRIGLNRWPVSALPLDLTGW